MKYFASVLFVMILVLAAVVGAAPPVLPNGGAGTEAPGMFGYTPVPKETPVSGSSEKGAAVKKQPLTASLAKDDKGKNEATVFAPADTIYLLWRDTTAPKGTKVRVAWYAEDTGKVFPKGKKLSEFTQTIPGLGAFGSSISPTVKGGLPVGTYHADVYENTTMAKSLKFTVAKK